MLGFMDASRQIYEFLVLIDDIFMFFFDCNNTYVLGFTVPHGLRLGSDFALFVVVFLVDDVEMEPLGGCAMHIAGEAMKPCPPVNFYVCNDVHLEASKAYLNLK
jgi:hypothetical protein